jgi:hypothetical protein
MINYRGRVHDRYLVRIFTGLTSGLVRLASESYAMWVYSDGHGTYPHVCHLRRS